MKNTNRSILHKDGVSYILPFILVTSCFALWGFANDITNGKGFLENIPYERH